MNKENFEIPFLNEPFNETRAEQFEDDTDSYLDKFFESLRK